MSRRSHTRRRCCSSTRSTSSSSARSSPDLSGSRASGLIGATFWALHFRLAEAVLRPCAVPDPLALLFGLSAVLLLLGGRRGWAAATFAAALLSKENAIVLLPLACLLLAMRGRRWLRETLVLWLLAAAYLGLELAVRSGGDLYFQLDWKAASRFWDIVLGFVGPDMTTVGQVLLGGRLPVVPLWLAVVLFAALAIAIWRVREPYRFALIWIVVTVLPTVFLGHQGSRYTYVPLVGVGMIVGEAGRSLWARATQRYQRGAVLAVATAWCVWSSCSGSISPRATTRSSVNSTGRRPSRSGARSCRR